MFKRCLLAVIVALLVTSSQIAAAEDYDWSKVKHVKNEYELCRYIEGCIKRGEKTFRIVFTNGFTLEHIMDEFVSSDGKRHLNEFTELMGITSVNFNGSWNQNRTEQFFTVKIGEELPGTRIANAYQRLNKISLSIEERRLYDRAVRIVKVANKLSSKEEKAKYIYDELRKIRTREGGYYTEEDKFTKSGKLKPFATAIGALNNRQANCEGYADSFYMLCKMAGINNVSRFSGYINNGDGHSWNSIDFGDGKVYFVDVTNGIFKATSGEIRKKSFRWKWNIPNLQ